MDREPISPERDHPRVCGEHDMGLTEHQDRLGSSPRVRGTRSELHIGGVLHGIIPACAGNTTSTALLIVFGRDHPRMCGEHLKIYDDDAKEMGSSPRVRGTL